MTPLDCFWQTQARFGPECEILTPLVSRFDMSCRYEPCGVFSSNSLGVCSERDAKRPCDTL